jgi:hypothetical protein
MKERVEEFFLHCSGSIALMIQTFGHNKARQREKIPALLEELANAQEEVIDIFFISNCFSDNKTFANRLTDLMDIFQEFYRPIQVHLI